MIKKKRKYNKKIEIPRGACIIREYGIWYLYFNKERSSFGHTINQWSQFFYPERYNWHTFDFLKLQFENDDLAPGYELVFIFLGLGFRIRVNRDWTGTELDRSIKNIEKQRKKRTLRGINFDEFTDRLDLKNLKKRKGIKWIKDILKIK